MKLEVLDLSGGLVRKWPGLPLIHVLRIGWHQLLKPIEFGVELSRDTYLPSSLVDVRGDLIVRFLASMDVHVFSSGRLAGFFVDNVRIWGGASCTSLSLVHGVRPRRLFHFIFHLSVREARVVLASRQRTVPNPSPGMPGSGVSGPWKASVRHPQ